MYAKYAILKKATRIINFKDHGTALQQTAGDIQNGFRGAEDPGAQDPNLTFETQTLCGQPVLYVKHKQPVQKVCIYVVGNDLGM